LRVFIDFGLKKIIQCRNVALPCTQDGRETDRRLESLATKGPKKVEHKLEKREASCTRRRGRQGTVTRWCRNHGV